MTIRKRTSPKLVAFNVWFDKLPDYFKIQHTGALYEKYANEVDFYKQFAYHSFNLQINKRKTQS